MSALNLGPIFLSTDDRCFGKLKGQHSRRKYRCCFYENQQSDKLKIRLMVPVFCLNNVGRYLFCLSYVFSLSCVFFSNRFLSYGF